MSMKPSSVAAALRTIEGLQIDWTKHRVFVTTSNGETITGDPGSPHDGALVLRRNGLVVFVALDAIEIIGVERV